MKAVFFKRIFHLTKTLIGKCYTVLVAKKEKITPESLGYYIRKLIRSYQNQFKILEFQELLVKKTREEVWIHNNMHSQDLLETIQLSLEKVPKFTVYLFVHDNYDLSRCLEALQKQRDFVDHLHITFFNGEEVPVFNDFGGIAVSCHTVCEFEELANMVTNWTNSIFMDSNIVLEQDALLRIAYAANIYTFNLCYADAKHDRSLIFKPDWSPQHLLSTNYVGNFFLIGEYTNWNQDYFNWSAGEALLYHFVLQFTEENPKIYHMQQILFQEGFSRSKAKQDYRKVLEKCLNRRSVKVETQDTGLADVVGYPVFDLEFPDEGPEVTIIIPAESGCDNLSRCVASLEKTSYRNYRITIIHNEICGEELMSYLEAQKEKGIGVLATANSPGRGFSRFCANNIAAGKSDTEYLIFLRDNTEIQNEKWLSNMVGYCKMVNVGVVGARILYPDRTIRGSGRVMGMVDGVAAPAFIGMSEKDGGYMGYAKTTRNYSVVMDECVLVAKDTFLKAGMFDSISFPAVYGSDDFCLKVLLEQMKEIVCVSGAVVVCHEKKTDCVYSLDETLRFKEKFKNYTDPYYNPNLSLENGRFEINVDNSFVYRAVPLRKQKVVAITHNLNYEGAPLQIVEIVQGLRKNNDFEFEIWSPVDGPLKDGILAEYGIKVQIVPFGKRAGMPESVKEYRTAFDWYKEMLKSEKVDCLIANTLESFYGIDCASDLEIPVVWLIHESANYASYFKHLDMELQERYLKCFTKAYKLVFVAKATQAIYEKLDTNNCAATIHNGIILDEYRQYKEAVSKAEARENLGIPTDKKVALMVGTTCERKGQLDILQGLKIMKDQHNLDQLTVYIVGGRESVYLDKMRRYIKAHDLSDYVHIVMETRDVNLYYRASDLFLFTSYNESYPRVILEAMAFDLPIITTPVYGVMEQVFEGVNGQFFDPGDTEKLAELITMFLSDHEKYAFCANNSGKVLQLINSYDGMIKAYRDVLEHMRYVNYRK